MRLVASAVATLFLSSTALAQVPPAARATQAPPPPATKLEAFEPSAGSLTTLGYDVLGEVGYGGAISVEAREVRSAKGAIARGLLVRVRESEYSRDNAFIDADEIPELIKGIDAILATTANPTAFQNFETRYTTRGELEVTAYSSSRNAQIRFAIKAGRVTTSQVISLQAADITKFRAMIVAANEKLASLGK